LILQPKIGKAAPPPDGLIMTETTVVTIIFDLSVLIKPLQEERVIAR
jgi:hypothetical protein